MNFFPENHRDKFIRLHADCIPVKGATRSVICDLTRNELLFFPTECYELLEYMLSDRLAGLMDALECEEDKTSLIEFIRFLDKNEVLTFLKDPAMFPPIGEAWDFPAVIHNAIIDIDEVYHDFDKIFDELDSLGCHFIQIRSFSNLLKLEDFYHVISASYHKSIQGVELIIRYDADVTDEMYINMIEDQPIISSLVVHSSPEDRQLAVDYGCDEDLSRYIRKTVRMISQEVNSERHCGIITLDNLNPPSIENFFATKLFNGCLNRKVAIDARGEIKNCPSMNRSYGNINDTSIDAAITRTGFKDKWNITKDQVETCKDCEFRYVCSDCRAYLEEPGNIYSKPLKCGYDPYSNKWEEWSSNPLKQKVINYYGMQEIVANETILQGLETETQE